ncbi:putative uncharacterized protein [Coprobacillus sp. CAG:826]|nr:putative uncharacterized protein [Coprobacillus sp. CAG:826]
MSQRKNKFFKEKKKWSLTKDKILGKYLVPYFQKLMCYGRPICYVDCFAGKGKFDDGQDGSPLIALKCLDKTLSKSSRNIPVYSYFIELNHYTDLEKNIRLYLTSFKNISKIEYSVKSGKFEDNIDSILSEHKDSTVFLYIDPYGIKAIDVEKFNKFKTDEKKSVELLINFNTWGFFREACRVLKVDFKLNPEIEKYLVEYDSNNNLNREELCKIAGGDFWIEIVKKYKNKELKANEAEYELAKNIAEKFRKMYKYTLNVPVMSSDSSSIPKYRLFYLTNHTDGYLIMADIMFHELEEAKIRQRNGQMDLFSTDTEGKITQDEDIEKLIKTMIKMYNEHIDALLCRVYTEYGLIAQSSKLREIIKDMEDNEILLITREPMYTKTGKLSSFMIESKGQYVYVRRK